MDIMLVHLLIKLATYMLYISIKFPCLSFIGLLFILLFKLPTQMNNH